MDEARKKEIRVKLGNYFEAVDAMATLLADTSVSEDQNAILDTIRGSMDNIRELWKEYSEVTVNIDAVKRVLVVDDNAVQRIFSQKVLEKEGFMVVVAQNGVQALELLTKDAFDLMILDCQMPVLDGFEVIEKFRALEKSQGKKMAMPVLALTEHGMAGYRERCLQAGMSEYRRKPLASKELISVAKGLVGAQINLK